MAVSPSVASPDVTFPIIEDRLYYAERAMVLWLQGLFRTRGIGDYRWHSNPDETEILITSHDPADPERTNKRPNIVVSRSHMSYAGSSMGQVSESSFTRDTATYTDMIQGQFLLTVIAQTGPEAQGIAYSLTRLIPLFRGVLNRLGRMHILPGRMSITPESQYAEVSQGAQAPRRKAVMVALPVSIQDSFSIDEGRYQSFLRSVEENITSLGGG
jgi:hypothetical protein